MGHLIDFDPGIPSLDLTRAAYNLPCPVLPYGAVALDRHTRGTKHFYVRDKAFSGVWDNPRRILQSDCSVAVEVNYSTQADFPPWQVLADIARKRTLARLWQSLGIRIIVDLNVEPAFRDLSLLGVPPGWSSYATRSHRGFGLDSLHADFAQGAARASLGGIPATGVFFVVFGGGRKVKAECEANGWTFVPERSHVVRGIEPDYTEA